MPAEDSRRLDANLVLRWPHTPKKVFSRGGFEEIAFMQRYIGSLIPAFS